MTLKVISIDLAFDDVVCEEKVDKEELRHDDTTTPCTQADDGMR